VYFFYYYPVGVDVGRPRVPVATLTLLAGLTAVYAVSTYLRVEVPVDWWAYAYRPAQLSWVTPLTACFLHGSWMHLLGNLLYLWVFAPALEKGLGRWGMLLVFVATGYLSNLAQGAVTMEWTPQRQWEGVVGASGAISGMLGWFLLRYPYARIKLAYWAFLPLQGINRTGTTYLHVSVGILLWLMLQVVFAWVAGGAGSTAYGAHIGGLLAGLVLGLSVGQVGKGRIEHLLVKADRCRRAGNVLGALGWLERYLRRRPDDEAARLAYARQLSVARRSGSAHRVYREVLQRRLAEGDLGSAAEIYLEARRGSSVFVAAPDDQKKIAFWLEKSTRFAEAVTAYLDLARFYPEHEHREHALARASSLLVTRLKDRREGLAILDEALEGCSDDTWRPLLERERFRLRRALA
jgi:membrane associated rhomboid family serine protease